MPAGSRPSARPSRPTPKRRRRRSRSARSTWRSPKSQAAHERANAALAERRNALTEAREQGHELAHQLATARARRDTVTRRLAELERLDTSLKGDVSREEALQRDATQAIAQLDHERGDIERRLADLEGRSARIASELSSAETISREAEAALAEVLARQAAMRAERRVAEAALEAARSQHARTEQESARLAEQLKALGDGSEQTLAQSEAEAKAQAAARALADAEARRVDAERERASAAEQRIRRKARWHRRGPRCPHPNRNMTPWRARSSMAAARRSPASRPSRALNTRWRRPWARTPTRPSAAIRRAGGPGAGRSPAIHRFRPASPASPTM